ncbi:MAG: DUF427 domain-containing protein [Anaerolineales bacterium]
MPFNRDQPGPGQESVWDYPRPPRFERTNKHIRVVFNEEVIADTHQAIRVLETSHPPVYYIPPSDVKTAAIRPNSASSFCEWKGRAGYYDVVVGDQEARQAAWYYPRPLPGFEVIKDHIAFYPQKMDECTVDGEIVQPQPGGFYGGWITSDITGPFKGGPGTMGW